MVASTYGRAPRPRTPTPTQSNGGPSSYYDFQAGWTTWNDFAEHKSINQWKEYSLHFKDIGKALCRFGLKSGTSSSYDARKIVYSGLRILGMLDGKEEMRKYLLELLDDDQFQ